MVVLAALGITVGLGIDVAWRPSTVGDIDINKLVKFHFQQGRKATLTGTIPPGRFGALEISDNSVFRFMEKPKGDGARINGGFFVLSPEVIDLIDGDATEWEREPLERLADNGELSAFIHTGFWQPMDTLRDKNYLEKLWRSGKAPWKLWDE